MPPHILLVEDDDGTRTALSFVLKRAGYRISTASDGTEALHMLTQTTTEEQPYDVVLTDIVMPNVDGIAVMKAALQQQSPPAVVLLTGYASVDTAIEALRSGAYDYLQKPCKNTDLLRCLEKAIHHRAIVMHQAQSIHLLAQTAIQLHQQSTRLSDWYRDLDQTMRTEEGILPVPDTPQETPEMLSPTEHYLRAGDICIDQYRQTATINGHPLHLTPFEYALLSCLVQEQGHVLTPVGLVQMTRHYRATTQEARSLIKPHILRLRRKLPPVYLRTVRGRGYMLVVPDEKNEQQPPD